MLFMKKILALTIALLAIHFLHAQACTPAGDETTYGTSDTWIGYVYDNMDFTNYSGFVNEGTTGNPNFDESFGGDYVNYTTNGCPVLTETFSVRYKLTKTFLPGTYQFIVGADDGYRLSLDGGTTWVINKWVDQGYAFTVANVTLNGTYNMVLEYYENGGGNRISFSVANACAPTDDQTIYGTGDVWRGYIYQGTNFDAYSGYVTEGTSGNPNFNESFGGDNVLYNTSSCVIATEGFSARYRLQKTFVAHNYSITVGGDDGYRLSLDGGATWVINNWGDHSYATTTYNAPLSGTYDMVLEYYENGGGNEVSFNAVINSTLPVQLISFEGRAIDKSIILNWKVASELNTDVYQIERSANGTDFSPIGKTDASAAIVADKTYTYTDASPLNGINYYRLRMVDKDGKFSFSPVIKILSDDKKGVSIFPTLVSNAAIYLKTSSALNNAVIDVYEMNGKQVKQIKLPSLVSTGQTISLQVPGLSGGSYVLICKTSAEIKSKQIILVQ